MSRWNLGWTLVLSACITDFAITEKVEDPVEAIDTDVGLSPEVEAPDRPDVEEDPEDPVIEEPPEVEDPPEVIDDPPPADDCTTTSDLIYLLSRDDDGIYLFDPTTLDVDFVGTLNCTPWGTPGSMAVARDGVAYVRYSDNSIYEVDLDTMACSSTAYSAGGFGAFGMGFATDNAGTWRDQLYIANYNKLAHLGTNNWNRTLLGNMPSQSEMTGNSAGELWAFLPLESPAQLVRLTKQTGVPLQNFPLHNFPNPFDIDAFAFAGWGGEFWLFVRTYGMGSTTDIFRVDGQGRMTVEARDIGLDIVGAGTSTCAPW